MEREQFTLFDYLKASGLPRERFRSWMKAGYIKPSIQTATGPGRGADTKNLFSRLDLYGITLFWYMVEKMKLPREEVGKLVNEWLEEVAFWTEWGGVDDTQLRVLLKKCNVITIIRINGEYQFLPQEFLSEIRNRVNETAVRNRTKLGGNFSKKELKLQDQFLEKVKDSSLRYYNDSQQAIHLQVTDPNEEALWSWVLHINFAKIRDAVNKLFP